MKDYQREFIEFAIEKQVLRFGEFTLKSGRRNDESVHPNFLRWSTASTMELDTNNAVSMMKRFNAITCKEGSGI